MKTTAADHQSPCAPMGALLKSVSCAATFVVMSATASVSQSAFDSGWSYTIAPYLWGTSLAGTVAPGGGLPPVDVDASFSDILDNLDFAAMVAANAQKGPWGVSVDLQYTNLGNSAATPGSAFGTATLDITQQIITLTGEYQLNKTSTSELWGAVGARYWSVDNDISFTPGRLPGRSVSLEDSWFDPVIGLRGRYDVADRTFLLGWAYVGGFGAGSEFMADVFGGIGYKFTPTTSGIFGYRYLSVDRENGDFIYDVEMQGLMAGLSFKF